MTIHTSTYKGKRVYVLLKDGTRIVDKFKDKKSGYVVLEEHGKIQKSKIKTMTIYRNTPSTSPVIPAKLEKDVPKK
ncbi:hypothetical protein HOG98_07745 [bacterium]|jgi:hypothetical protein|nr:hypothetical protein [bacterium]